MTLYNLACDFDLYTDITEGEIGFHDMDEDKFVILTEGYEDDELLDLVLWGPLNAYMDVPIRELEISAKKNKMSIFIDDEEATAIRREREQK